MAGNIGDLQVNLSANTSQMERDVSAALKRLETKGFNFGAGINSKAFTQPLGRITGASNEFQKSLDASNARVIAFGASAGAIYIVQRAFTSLITSTIEVQKSLTDINVILGTSQKTLGQFGDSLFEIAKNSGQAFSTVATAAGELARQGLSVEQTLKRTSDALILTRLSGLDAASSVEALTASINSFNSSALDSTQIVNKLASVDAAFAVSSGDLAEALKRVGSSAQDVGVSFDELLAIVASVNQTTARGGAVIGNSLKTIFTRVQRTEVLDQLQNLGVAVRDLNGNTAPAIQILTGLATKFDDLGTAQKAQVAELVGGVFQINILKAALGDLSKEYSVYGNALKISQGATDEAIRRNEELNKTLSALLNKTVANLTRVGSDIGALSFAPAIEKVLGGINTALEAFDVKGDGIGSKIGKGIFEGIGSFISGPGLAILIGVFIKLFGNLAKFTTDAIRTVLGLNKEAQAQAQIQERINTILSQNPQLIQNIVNKQVSLLQVERDILTVIQAQSQARQQSNAIATSLTRGLINKGVTSEKGVITAKTKSQGFIPNFNANKEMMGAISGGYMPGNIRSMNIPNYGRVTYNDAETVKQFSGLSQPGIMPPADSEAGKAYKQKFKDKYGINPYASSGFVPNFAGIRPEVQQKIDKAISTGKLQGLTPNKTGVLSNANSEELAAIDLAKKQIQGLRPAAKTSNIERTVDARGIATMLVPKEGYTSSNGQYTFREGINAGTQVIWPTKTYNPKHKDPTSILDIQNEIEKGIANGVMSYAASINPPANTPSSRAVISAIESTPGAKGSVQAAAGGAFEVGLGLALGLKAASAEGLEFDVLSANPKLQQLFGYSTPLADFKINDESDRNRKSMAHKILGAQKVLGKGVFTTTQGLTGKEMQEERAGRVSTVKDYLKSNKKYSSLGFVPNFSPLDKALKTEKKMGGRGVLDFKPGLGLYVRDGETQPNFAAVMRDHPEGIANATQNSKRMQSSMSAGFIPNFAGLDPMSMFFMMQSMGGGGSQGAANLKNEEAKLGQILNERGRVESEILNISKSGKGNRQKIKQLEGEKIRLDAEEVNQRRSIQNQTPIFARKGGSFVGGAGGVAGRAFNKYGTGLAFAAPMLADTASQFIGDDASRGGRSQKAAVSGLGTVASYAGLGSMIAPGIGTAVGAGVGGAMAAYDVYQKFNDIMPELKDQAEKAQEKLSNVASSTQLLNVSLDTLSNAQTNNGLSAEQSVRLQSKATEDFATSLSKLDLILPGAGQEIQNLYNKIGDTAELRMKINEIQATAQKEAQATMSGASLTSKSRSIQDLAGPGFFEGFYGAMGTTQSMDTRVKNLKPSEQKAFQQSINSGSGDLKSLFDSLSKTGEAIKSSQVSELLDAFNKDGIPGVKNLATGLLKTGDDSAYVSEILSEIDPEIVTRFFKTWLFLQGRTEVLQKQVNEANQSIKTGARPIRTLQELQQQFANPGGITPEALNRIDYSSASGIESSLMGAKDQNFAKQVTTGFEDLSNSLGYSADRVQYLSQYTEKASQIQKDWNNGAITTTQAFERLKLAIDAVEFEKGAKNMFSGDRASARQGLLEGQLKQGNLAQGFDPLTSFFDRFGDNAATTADKINKSFGNLAENMQTGFEDAFGAFLDGTKTADDAMKSMLLSISQQIIKEQFSIGMRSIIGGVTGGGGYGSSSGQNGGGILGSILGLFGGGKAQGGIIRKYSSGGHVQGGSGTKDDVPAMLTDGEYVLRKSAVNKYGKGTLDMLNNGGMVRGYAGGGSINSSLSNSYDFFGSKGEKLTENYTPEAFKTTVNAPSELANIPALTGKFNISDMLSSRGLMDEGNPMNALRNQRFLEMQGYQEQVSNFKTGYNEQYYQVEQQRKEAQRAADEENSRRMSAYNSQRSQMLIGGLMSAGMSLFGGLASSGALNGITGSSALQNFMGGGGGGGGGGIGGSLLSGLGNIFSQGQQAASYGKGMPTSMGTKSAYELEQIKKSISDSIEGNQFSGYGDPFSKKQSQLFPQFGGQSGFGGGGYGGMNFGQPTSSIGGFQYGVGLGAPAGFQTQFQTKQDYLMNFASPIAPIAPGRGNLVYDFLNQNSNPFGYQSGYAKGGLVRGYQTGGKANQYLPASALNLRTKGSDGNTYTLAQMGLTTNSTYADLQKMGGQAFGGGYNSPELLNLMGGIQGSLGSNFNRLTAMNDTFHQAQRPGSLHTAGSKTDFTLNDYTAGKKQIKEYLSSVGLSEKDYSLNFEGSQTPGATGTHFDFQLNKSGTSKIAAMNMGMPAGNIAGTNTPAVMAGFGLPSKQSFPLTAFSPSTNSIAKGIDTIGKQDNPFSNQAKSTNTATNAPAFPATAAAFNTNRLNATPFNIPQSATNTPSISAANSKMFKGSLGSPAKDFYRNNPVAEFSSKKITPQTAQAVQQAITQQDLLGMNQQSSDQILPFFQNLADTASGNKQNLYKSVGSLYDMKNKGDYSKLSSKFSSFYGNNQNNRYSSSGEKGFNNYLKYIGADPYSTMSSLNSFKFPMTPNTYSPFAFGSQNFGGFGGSGYQSGFTSTGNAFSNYFSTGSRLGITPSWASRATGGMIYGGTSAKDDVPAMLMGGEYVIRKDVVDRMGEPFFNSLNRGKPQGFAEGGPVGTGLPSVVGGGSNQQDNSRSQFVDSITKLVKSLEQLNKGIEEQNKDSKVKTNGGSESSDSSSSGVTNNISINVNVDQNGKTTDSKKEEDQSGGGSKEETDQEKFKKTMEKSRILAELLRQQVLKTIVEEQRPGGVLYGGSKGRDMGR
jgi:TP901 family phage tail tape measure protein